MQSIRDIYRQKGAEGRPVISLEFFPPKTPQGDTTLLEKTLPAFRQVEPDFCSVTYGAGGSTREKTLDIVQAIQDKLELTAMAHLTCVGNTREQIGQILDEAWRRGIRNILALRGDPPKGMEEWQATEGGFTYSSELVAYIRGRHPFSIGVAGFPEGHIACQDGREADWDHLANKVRAGADFVITQLFFDNADFFRFRDYLTSKHRIEVPLVPGIIPIMSATQIKRFTAMCGARLPEPLLKKLDELGEDDEAVRAFGVEYAARQSEELLKAGAPGLHMYTLNKVKSTRAILDQLGLAPAGDPN